VNGQPNAEKTYTLAQAQVELAKQQCAANGHAPGEVIHRGIEPVHAYCDCGLIKWLPVMHRLRG
jgi:hypothetical protein